MSSTSSPALARTVDLRPSQPTVSLARTSSGPSGVVRAHADDAPVLLDEVDDIGLHDELEVRIRARLVGEEVEEVPLRHQRDERVPRRQPGEVGDVDRGVADLHAEPCHLVVRQLQQVVEQPQLVHHLERRGMDGVAAEVAQEVGVLLQHHDVDAGARQQQPEHHAGRTAAGDAAGGRQFARHGCLADHWFWFSPHACISDLKR